jgi:hypothetical protein
MNVSDLVGLEVNIKDIRSARFLLTNEHKSYVKCFDAAKTEDDKKYWRDMWLKYTQYILEFVEVTGGGLYLVVDHDAREPQPAITLENAVPDVVVPDPPAATEAVNVEEYLTDSVSKRFKEEAQMLRFRTQSNDDFDVDACKIERARLHHRYLFLMELEREGGYQQLQTITKHMRVAEQELENTKRLIMRRLGY